MARPCGRLHTRVWRCGGNNPSTLERPLQWKSTLFKPRVEALLQALRKLEPKNDAVISCLEAAYRMADKRNTIAHNPMQAQVFQHGRTGELLVELAISSVTIDDYIDDAELKELRAEAEDLVTQLYMSLGFVEKRAGNG